MSLVDNTKPPNLADLFRKMADLLDRNADQPFGGAFVIIPPGLEVREIGEPLTSLFLNEGSAGLFWGTLKTIVTQEIDKIDTAQRQLQSGLGRR